MRQYVAKRVAHAIFIMWLVATTVFFGLRLIPGGPVRTMLGQEATPKAVAALRAKLGLNQPLYVQYFDWLKEMLTLHFGQSLSTGQPVSTLVSQAAPKTLSIAILAIIIGLGVAIPTGIISATRKGEPVDYAATVTAFLGVSMPAFFVGILLALVFGVWLNLLPVFGYTPPSEGLVPWLESVLLPGIAVGLPYAAVVMRMMRSSLLEVLNEPYMRTARAKGVNGRVMLFKHALQNALIPVITVAGIQLALVLVGSVTVELVFGIQGLGRLLVDSMLDRNYPVTQAVILIVAAVMVFTNLAVDLVYTVIDPRIGYGGNQ
ncbi:ABC-type dipeptide/oligopeptide/nickel transport system, permease protein I [Haladaptatus paucihalophilus DX253]|uniref:ABC-type dipeptide/oligopeptide/nickel transport system, permease protein I n=1 Tax=Haladaptatus paucihalophilus DX253 TaxID=797209 RepID=E7QPL4_HALPU|nr:MULTISPECIES: ABC transporter permease [Haladaptatus]EFW93497.1 ABC-type dipeptide/oligopeptide/nickel transport system, permease protein I [Haladaptatus paucihalophilus DX253]GKZ15901.1 ABC transporter permease [Haladaptatus sp. T7]SHL20732.1 peptide/nickel transport system permease protein [Haladaptatus paucihalophilus DX253]